MHRLHHLLDVQLVRISGTPITPAALLIGAAVVAFTLMFAGLVGRGVRRLLARRGLPLGTQFAAAKIVRYTLIAIGLLAAINSMGLRLDALLAASAVLAVGIGFGLQNIAQNFVSGVILLVEQPVRKGDFIRVGDAVGEIEDIGLRATRVITRDEVTIIVPNSSLISDPVINHSRPTTNLRIWVSVGVAYGSDTQLVCKTLLEVGRSHPQVLQHPEPEVRFDSFGDSSLNFSLLCWIADPHEDLHISSDLRFAIDAAFREKKIEIPFPQRDLNLRGGLERLLELRKSEAA